jgi:hypothetical protein
MASNVVRFKGRRVATKVQHGPTQPSASLGKLCGLALPEGVWVEVPCTGVRAIARVAIECDIGRLQHAIDQEQPAVLTFEDGDRSRPILIGLIAPPRELPAVEEPHKPSGFEVEADADGYRVHLKAREEIVLQCGDSSISLKRNGRVVIRGAYVETNAATTNRIKGGSVRIN